MQIKLIKAKSVIKTFKHNIAFILQALFLPVILEDLSNIKYVCTNLTCSLKTLTSTTLSPEKQNNLAHPKRKKKICKQQDCAF